jgi:membrane-bound ClpP family serine protease
MFDLKLLPVIAKARSKKRRPCLPLVCSSAVVNTDLNPRGSVLADGDLWIAEAWDRKPIPHQTKVTVVGFRDHLLLVQEKIFRSPKQA